MALFISDEELRRHANNAALVAEKADSYIRDLQKQLETYKAQADAAAITAEQSCAIIEQKYISLSAEFEKLESQNAQLTASHDQSLAELAEVQAEKHQLHLKAINKDGEFERLSIDSAEIQKSKRQLLELLEQKDMEIKEKNGTIKCYLDKIVNLTDAANLKEARLHDSEAELARSLAVCARLSQEKELVERHNVWLNEELTAKVNSVLEIRRSHSELEAEMSAKLAEVEKQLNECSGSLKRNSDRVKELEGKLTSAQEELCSAKDTAAAYEEHVSAELSAASKLVELYKESNEEWSRKAGELEGVIKALETHLSQVEDDYKDKLEKETSVKNTLEKEAADLKEKLEKCESEMENARKRNELGLLQLVDLQGYSKDREIMIGGREGEEGNECDKMIVPRIPLGVSGTALAASLLRDGWSLAKMYAKYQEAVDALRHEQMGRKHSQAILERVLYEIQEKAEVILDERSEHERMVEAYAVMDQKLQQSLAEQSNYETTIRELKADLKIHERDYGVAQKEIQDLEKQVTVLLKECRDIQLRCGASNHGSLVDSFTLPDVGMDESEADKVISERLLTFRDINELVEQNVQLRSLVRNLVGQSEQKEIELKERFEMELRKQNDEVAAKVEAVLKRSEEQGLMIESLHNSVGMYKRLYEEELKSHAALPHSVEAIPEDGKKDFMHIFEGQETSKKALEQVSERAKKLEDDLAKSRNEVISLRLERDKLALEANFARERLDGVIKESEHQRDETNGIRARNVEFSQLIIDYQRRIRESSQSLQASEELSRKLSMEVTILKRERDILLSSENRASDEVRRLYEEKHRIQASLDTIHSAEEIREESRATERRKLEESLNRAEREWAEAKQELQDERNHVRALSVEREEILKNSMRQVEEMRKELTDALRALSTAEAKAVLLEAQCSGLEAKLKVFEIKVGEKGSGLNLPAICSPEEVTTDQQKEKEEIETLKQELQVYKDHMLQYKEIAQVNENALKQIESAHEKFKSEAEKMKKTLETEIHSLRGRISELESDVLAKSLEAASALADKENVLSSALAEIAGLRDESSIKRSEVEGMEAQISSLKEDLEKEHLRWRSAQNNYERQVLLQSDTIQELKRTSQALAVLQDESLELHKSVDTLKNENDLLKVSWVSEKSVLESLKNESEKKYNEVNEQNIILLNRLEALHIKLAERERNNPGISSSSSNQDPQGEGGLENVIRYLRRSKMMAETEVSLLKQEQLRLQSNLESALRASEAAQAALQAERANSRAMLFTEEEFKSLQLQVREMNLLRESNMQLREENRHNFEESQKSREIAKNAQVELEHLGSLLKEKDIELEASRKEVEILKIEIQQWEKRVSKLLERNKNIDVEDYDRMKEEFLRIQEKLTEVEAEVEDSRKLVSEKDKKIFDMEQDLSKKQFELTELEKRMQDTITAEVEKRLQLEVEKQKKFPLNWKRKNENLAKEVEDLKKEKQSLSKQLEDSRSSKRSIGETTKQHEAALRQELLAQHEKALKEQEMEKNTKIQTLVKALEREREGQSKLRSRQLKDRKAIFDLSEKVNQEKKKLEEELERHKQSRNNLFEASGSSPAQLTLENDLEEKGAAYILAVEQLEEAINSTLNDGPAIPSVSADASHVDTSSAPNDGKSNQVHAQALTTQQPILATPPTPQVKPMEEKEQKLTMPKPHTEARKLGRKLIRPRLEPSQEPSGDTDMTEMEGDSIPEEGVKFVGPPQDLDAPQFHRVSLPLPSTTARKRMASSSASELREELLTLQETRSDVVPPLPKKSRGSDTVQEGAEEPSKDLSSRSPKKLLFVEDSGEAAEDPTCAINKQEEPSKDLTAENPGMPLSLDDLDDIAEDPTHDLDKQEAVNAAKGEETDANAKQLDDPNASAEVLEDPKRTLDFVAEVESQNASDAIMEEMPENPTRVAEEPLDGGATGGEGLESQRSPLMEGEDDREEGELVSDFVELHEGVDIIVMTPEDGEAHSESFPDRSGVDMEDGSGGDAGDGIEITSPEVLHEKNEDGSGLMEGIAEGSDKSNNSDGPTEAELNSHAPNSASIETSQDVVAENVEPKQESPLVAETMEKEQQSSRSRTTIVLNERARERALIRQAGVVPPPLTRGRGRTRDVGHGGRGGRGVRRQLGNDSSEA